MDYIDTTLVECDRGTAQTKNDNLGTWTNNMNESIQMQPGDKVSVYSSFISEVGADQPLAVEFKGTTLGYKKDIKYTTEIKTDTTYSLIRAQISDETFPFTTDTQTTTETINVKDNEANMVINYYKTMDSLNYIQLPRRWIPSTDDPAVFNTDEKRQWYIEDSAEYGRVNREPYDVGAGKDISTVWGYVIDDYCPVYQKEPQFDDTNRNTWNMEIDRWILKNDNSKFTIMRKNKTYHYPKKYDYVPTPTGTEPTDYYTNMPDNRPLKYNNVKQQYYLPPYWDRDPESFNYDIYREKVKIGINSGFSSSQFISDEATKQLQETNVEKGFELQHGLGDRPALNPDPNPQIKYPLSLTAESKTYKIFHTTNDKNFSKAKYDTALNNSDNSNQPTLGETGPTRLVDPGNLTDPYQINLNDDFFSSSWYESLEYIAVKRPEIYSTGSKMNSIRGISHDNSVTSSYLSSQGTGFLLDLDYNADNCLLIKNFVESQAHYPELFSKENVMNMYEDTGTEVLNPYYHKVSVAVGDAADVNFLSKQETITMNATINNSRFMHINTRDSAKLNYVVADDKTFTGNIIDTLKSAPLGSSYYDWTGTTDTAGTRDWNFTAGGVPPVADTDVLKQSYPFLFYYDTTTKDKFFDTGIVSDIRMNLSSISQAKLTYGCMGRDRISGHIIIYPNLIAKSVAGGSGTGCGIPALVFATDVPGASLTAYWKVGFDRHWNAWGTAAIALTSGIPSTTRWWENVGAGVDPQFELGKTGPGILRDPQAPAGNTGQVAFYNFHSQTNVNPFFDKIYLGAPTATLGFDGSHFFFQNLHNILLQGDLENSSAGGTISSSVDPVYKINPAQKYNNYSPVQFPYQRSFLFDFKDPDLGTDQSRTPLNDNIYPNSVFDTDSGIFIEDMGFDEKSWESSYWNRLGFTYEQFHPLSNDRLKRHINQPDTIKYITTNAKIDVVDTKGWAVNQFQNRLYDGSLSHTYNVNIDLAPTGGTPNASTFRQLPQLIEKTDSIKILAANYPIKNFKGYYAIRSDILPATNFIGGGAGNTAMPIVGIIDKMQPAGDYYFGTENSVNFTITKPTLLSSISIAITDPDGSYSVVSERSSIIFRIDRRRKLDTNIANEILEKYKKVSP